MTFQELYNQEKEKEYFKRLAEFVNYEYKHYIVYPPKDSIFSALKVCELENIKVVILGQDPYHNENQAHECVSPCLLHKKKYHLHLLIFIRN